MFADRAGTLPACSRNLYCIGRRVGRRFIVGALFSSLLFITVIQAAFLAPPLPWLTRCVLTLKFTFWIVVRTGANRPRARQVQQDRLSPACHLLVRFFILHRALGPRQLAREHARIASKAAMIAPRRVLSSPQCGKVRSGQPLSSRLHVGDAQALDDGGVVGLGAVLDRLVREALLVSSMQPERTPSGPHEAGPKATRADRVFVAGLVTPFRSGIRFDPSRTICGV